MRAKPGSIRAGQLRGQDGSWKPIEEGLQEGPAAALENGNNSFDLSMPRKLGTGPVRITTEGGWVESELLGTETEAVDVEGNSAVYESRVVASTSN